jgi:hypothetical protein
MVTCSTTAYGLETINDEESLGYDAWGCNYLTVSQPSLATVEVGDTLTARVWHFKLTNPDPAEAHLAIQLDDEIVWEERFEIPQDARLRARTWTATRHFPAGAPVIFHLHNHGTNSYNFIELSVTDR